MKHFLNIFVLILAMPAFIFGQNNKKDEEKREDKAVIIKHDNDEKQSNEPVFFIVEQMPEYPGGELALRKFIAMNIKYPVEARSKNITGKVYVRFTVTKTGDVAQTNILRGVHPLLDQEALRVINLLPKWKPGKQRGKPVDVYYTIPISFGLETEKEKKMPRKNE